MMQPQGGVIEDPMWEFDVIRKYGFRWKQITRAKITARGLGISEFEHAEDSQGGGAQLAERQEIGGQWKDSSSRPPPSLSETTLPLQNPTQVPITVSCEAQTALATGKEITEAWEEKFKDWQKRLPKDMEDDRYYYFYFLGGAYIHRMMDGEAIGYQSVRNIKTQVFEMR
jgi:hypothetical protein